MHLADLNSYLEADHNLCELYADGDEWARKAILNIASSGKFSSDRTIVQYARSGMRSRVRCHKTDPRMTISVLMGKSAAAEAHKYN